MALSRNRRIRELIVKQEELRQRAAWAQGEERIRLLDELEEIGGQLDVMKGGRR